MKITQYQIIVQKNEISQYKSKIENLHYFEISCKKGYNINKVKDIIDNIEIEEEKGEDKIQENKIKKNNENNMRSCIIY
jgi:hypothetical protein